MIYLFEDKSFIHSFEDFCILIIEKQTMIFVWAFY